MYIFYNDQSSVKMWPYKWETIDVDFNSFQTQIVVLLYNVAYVHEYRNIDHPMIRCQTYITIYHTMTHVYVREKPMYECMNVWKCMKMLMYEFGYSCSYRVIWKYTWANTFVIVYYSYLKYISTFKSTFVFTHSDRYMYTYILLGGSREFACMCFYVC